MKFRPNQININILALNKWTEKTNYAKKKNIETVTIPFFFHHLFFSRSRNRCGFVHSVNGKTRFCPKKKIGRKEKYAYNWHNDEKESRNQIFKWKRVAKRNISMPTILRVNILTCNGQIHFARCFVFGKSQYTLDFAVVGWFYLFNRNTTLALVQATAKVFEFGIFVRKLMRQSNSLRYARYFEPKISLLNGNRKVNKTQEKKKNQTK